MKDEISLYDDYNNDNLIGRELSVALRVNSPITFDSNGVWYQIKTDESKKTVTISRVK